jgi:hypothetical protein
MKYVTCSRCLWRMPSRDLARHLLFKHGIREGVRGE